MGKRCTACGLVNYDNQTVCTVGTIGDDETGFRTEMGCGHPFDQPLPAPTRLDGALICHPSPSTRIPWGLKACDNPACPRQTSTGSAYCCYPCSLAATPPDVFDPEGYHSDGCNHRAAERGTR